MQSRFGEGSRPFFDFFSYWGGPTGWLLVASLVFWLSGSKSGLRVGFCTYLATITNVMSKWLLAYPRPYYLTDEIQAMKASSGFGMPSGHAQGVAGQWGAVVYFVRRNWCMYLAIVFILFTGAARVYYGLHSPAQVAVGWVLGFVAVAAVVWVQDSVVNWFRAKTLMVQLASILGVAAIIVLVGCGISVGLRGDFQPPAGWHSAGTSHREPPW